MRQLITRIDDDLHARLRELAQAEGRSVNALVIEALVRATGEPIDHRAAVRRRAQEVGLLVIPVPPVGAAPRHDVIAATRGAGTAVNSALAAERDAS